MFHMQGRQEIQDVVRLTEMFQEDVNVRISCYFCICDVISANKELLFKTF
jgi:hypothetical protein